MGQRLPSPSNLISSSTFTMATNSRSSRPNSNIMDPSQSNAVAVTTSPAVPPGECRLAKTTACLPIVYGSVAFYLGKKADENSTHQWTLYLRGNNNEDLSYCIQKVIFQLHPSFAIPVRELTAPPYEVTERGWGEFEAQIRIIWKDPTEKSTVVSHGIKLYPPGAAGNIVTADAEVPVVAESYDEVVFTDPTENFFRQLQRLATAPSITYSQQDHFTTFSDGDDFQALLEAQKFLQNELATVKERARMVEVELQQADQEHRAAQERSKTAAATTATGVVGATTAASTKNTGGAAAATTTSTTTAAAARKSKANTAAAAAAAAARGAPASKKAKTT